MNSLPQPLAQALRAFAPQDDEVRRLRQAVAAYRSDWDSLLRLPFEVAIETPATYGLAPEDSEPASCRYVIADEDDVRDAVDALIDRHIVELEADVKRRMDIRNFLDKQP